MPAPTAGLVENGALITMYRYVPLNWISVTGAMVLVATTVTRTHDAPPSSD